MYDALVIGLDQSYTRTGISIAADGKLLRITSEAFKGCKTKTDKRKRLISILEKIVPQACSRSARVAIICERVRLNSRGFISLNYIKSTGALIATIVDCAKQFGVKVYSVDTRSWKAQVVGTSKGVKGDPKLPTIRFICKLGFKDSICSINKKGEVVYDDDAADSACMALYGFIPKKLRKLKLEE